VQMDLARPGDRNRVLELIKNHPRIGLVRTQTGITSTAELKEYVMDLGRPRADLWENGVFEGSISVDGDDLYLFQAIHQEADVVVETIDCIRAMMGTITVAEESIALTNHSLGFSPIR
ncbi:MAG: glyceraldehyde-3-phosphate dehydrogenase, partial [Methanocalculus sp.]|nr:glyceraldehyde-3-phosphate dehydrogenase [Methanocalculus sp.]